MINISIGTWNVNSIIARLPRLMQFLHAHRPDVLCIQELKCLEDKFPLKDIEGLGYRAVVFGQKTYNGVAILSLDPQMQEIDRGGAVEGFPAYPDARYIGARCFGFDVFSVYAPNGREVGHDHYRYKLAFFHHLAQTIRGKVNLERLILTGDFNVALEDMDVYDPALWQGNNLFSLPERNALKEMLRSLDLIDPYRYLYPEERAFSWWDYRDLCFPKNKGLRIDYVFTAENQLKNLIDVRMLREERKGEKPSDHIPVVLKLKVTAIA